MRRSRPTVDERLALVLAVVPWLAEQGGATVDEIGARFSIDADEVMAVLSAAQCCEVPPYGGATIGIAVFEDGTVQVDPIVAFDRPLRFTADEAFGLVAAGRTALAVDEGAGVADGALQRGLAKLEAQLGGGVVVDLEAPPMLDELRSALDDRAQLRIDYYSASRDAASTRVVDPWALRSADGHWYLVAHCHQAADRRVFRVDRIDRVERTGEAVPPDSVDPRPDEPIAPGAEAPHARIRMPASQRWLLDTVVVSELVEDGDHVEVVLPVSGPTFLGQLVMRSGPGTEVLEPPELVDVGRAAARRILEQYDS